MRHPRPGTFETRTLTTCLLAERINQPHFSSLLFTALSILRLLSPYHPSLAFAPAEAPGFITFREGFAPPAVASVLTESTRRKARLRGELAVECED